MAKKLPDANAGGTDNALIVTGTLATQDGVNFYLEDLSHTYQQIEQAISSNQVPILAVNIGIISTGTTTFASLAGHDFNNLIQFSAFGNFYNALTKSIVYLFPDDTNSVIIEEIKEDKTYFVDADIVLDSNQNMMVRFAQDFETVQNAIKNGYNVIAKAKADLLQSGLNSIVPLSYYIEDFKIIFETILYHSNTYYRYTTGLFYDNATQFVMAPLEFSGSGEKEVEIVTGILNNELEVSSISHTYSQISTLLQNGKEIKLKLADLSSESSVLYLSFSCNLSNQVHIFSTTVSIFGSVIFYIVSIDSNDTISVITDGVKSVDSLLKLMAASGVSEGNQYFTTSDIVYKALKNLKAEDIVGALSEETLNTALTEALAAAKASGLFDGKDGKDGEDGQDGKTPVKGEDYFTAADKAEFLEQVKSSINIPENVTDLKDEANYATKTWAEEILNGKCKAYVFDYRSKDDPNYKKDPNAASKVVLDDWLQVIANVSNLKTGDVFLIRDVGVPDYWWDGDTSSKQILETTKVPLEEYAKLTDLKNFVELSYVTQELNKKQDTLDKYVKTVNGQSGDVTLTVAQLSDASNYVQNSTFQTELAKKLNTTDTYVKTVNGKSGDVTVSVPAALSQLSEDATHRVVTDAEKNAWNNKSNFSGSYNDLTGKPIISNKLNAGSATWYYPLGEMVIDNGSNYGNYTFTGRLGGWTNANTAVYSIMLMNRANYTGNIITSTVSASGAYDEAIKLTDIVVAKKDDLSHTVYLKCTGYFCYDFAWTAYQHSIIYNGNYTTTEPSNIVWRLSEAPKTILKSDGSFEASGGINATTIGGKQVVTSNSAPASGTSENVITFVY